MLLAVSVRQILIVFSISVKLRRGKICTPFGKVVDVGYPRSLVLYTVMVVVKIPITKIGVTEAAQMIRQGVRVTLTGVDAVFQVLIAAAIGAEYAAPYLGRIHGFGRNGCEELGAMQRSLSGVDSSTRLLVASIRRVEDIAVLAAQGLNTFTFSSAIAAQFFEVPATLKAAEAFEQAAQRLQLL
jgi:transaldolase